MDYIEINKKKRLELKKRKEQLEAELAKVTAEYDALNVLIGIIDPKTAAARQEQYPLNGNLHARIKYVLSKINKGSAADIEAYMRKFQKVSSNSVTIVTSVMAHEGHIKAVKEGRKNIYSLK